ncbi:MAG: hypothetical protein JSW39_06520 [Desulfobacterales bacterium]|nr:MAG: hypothetical protein JSW39_06520 [Desulfobacterales bacterium]
MMRGTGWFEKVAFFLIGVAAVLALLFLTGANNVPPTGRYQMDVVIRRDFADVYVIDTATGVVKWLDFKDESKPFDQIKSKK